MSAEQQVSDAFGVGISSPQKTKEQLRRRYVRVLYKVIDASDILILDTRDPEECRTQLVEEESGDEKAKARS
ncbi:hypothetical protein JVU11DRAFT_7149 [Chiua virens]|nr:hypothetical protein JVU11DRAFT_7149 [Chiua virens]